MKKILVIEDETDIRENIIDLLSEEGYLAVGAKDGEEGIHKIWQEFPDLVLCDILMPKVDGYGVLTVVSKSPVTSTIPFIFLTAKTQREDLRKGMALGADDYITKPFTRLELLQAIETRLLKHEQLRLQAQQKLIELRTSISLSLPHELLTPLSVILGFSEYLLNNLSADPVNLQTLEIVRDIHNAAKRLLHSLQKYLFYAEMEVILSDAEKITKARHSRFRITEGDIKTAISAIPESVEREEDIHIEAAQALVCISDTYFHKLVEELVENAIKFSPAGSPIYLIGESLRENGLYRLQVLDHGKGMTPEQVAGISGFIPKDRKLYYSQRSGLGLEIVSKILDIYQGTISIQSEPGSYTKVEVFLRLG
ncbi:MAG TPA: hybrid sensor histidine kinase/response regulator [Anaerolineaceae bacterium]|nr:hybrid sensor histidine kinase/response regulator [Anaerolineaceae bacterium]